MGRTFAVVALAVALLLPAACRGGPAGTSSLGGGWTEAAAEAHPALPETTRVVWWVRGTGPGRERLGVLRDGAGRDVRPESPHDLARHCRPIASPGAARAFGELAWLLRTPGLPVDGDPVSPDATLRGMGTGGRYSTADAAAWEMTFDAPALPSGGGWEIEQVVLVAPATHPDFGFASPWRLVLVRGVVYPDGAVTLVDQRTLTNGRDAQRFVRF